MEILVRAMEILVRAMEILLTFFALSYPQLILSDFEDAVVFHVRVKSSLESDEN